MLMRQSVPMLYYGDEVGLSAAEVKGQSERLDRCIWRLMLVLESGQLAVRLDQQGINLQRLPQVKRRFLEVVFLDECETSVE